MRDLRARGYGWSPLDQRHTVIRASAQWTCGHDLRGLSSESGCGRRRGEATGTLRLGEPQGVVWWPVGGGSVRSRVPTVTVRVVASGCRPGGFLRVRDMVDRVVPPDSSPTIRGRTGPGAGLRHYALADRKYGISCYILRLFRNDVGGRLWEGLNSGQRTGNGSVGGILLATFIPTNFGPNSRFNPRSRPGDELHQIVLLTRQGGQLGLDVCDYIHESLVRYLRTNGLRTGSRWNGRRRGHSENRVGWGRLLHSAGY